MNRLTVDTLHTIQSKDLREYVLGILTKDPEAVVTYDVVPMGRSDTELVRISHKPGNCGCPDTMEHKVYFAAPLGTGVFHKLHVIMPSEKAVWKLAELVCSGQPTAAEAN